MGRARLSISKCLSARQYNNQTTGRVTAYDTPFADILLPISRNAIGSKIPVPRPPYSKRELRLHEIGSKSIELSNADDIALHSRDVDTSGKESSISALKQQMDQGANKTTAKTYWLGDHPPEHNASRGTPASVASEDAKSFVSHPLPSQAEESSGSLKNMEEPDRKLPVNQEAISSAENYQEVDVQPVVQLSETASHTDLASEKPVSRTIHILGCKAVGKFFAHALAGAPNPPPVTLLVHRPWLVKKWRDGGGTIKLQRGSQIDEKTGVNVELIDSFNAQSPTWSSRDIRPQNLLHGPQDAIIDNLVVTTEGYDTVSALAAVQHRLLPSSTICFVQDSVCIVDYVNSSVFPDPKRRPNYVLGNMSHKIYPTQDEYSIVEHRAGSLAFSTIPREVQDPQIKEGEVTIRRMDLCWQPSSKYLMRTLSQAPNLGPASLNPRPFYKKALQILAVDSVLGSVTAVYECFNDQLLYNREASWIIKLLLKEISLILRSLPEISGKPSIDDVFSLKRLEILVFSVIEKTGRNRTSMLQDIMQGKKTKIDFCNGWLLRRAEALGIDCPNLEMITWMVKGKESMRRREKHSVMPVQHHR